MASFDRFHVKAQAREIKKRWEGVGWEFGGGGGGFEEVQSTSYY